MADFVKFGTFSTRTSVGTYTEIDEASDLGGDTPGLVEIFAFPVTADDTVVGEFGFSYGAITPSSGKGATAVYRDGGNSGRREANGTTAGAGLLLIGANPTIRVAAVGSIVGGTGVQFNYSAVDASNAYHVWWFAFGGDSFAANVGYGTSHSGQTGLAFDPELASFCHTDLGEDSAFSICTIGLSYSDGTTHGNIAAEDNEVDGTDYASAYGQYGPARLLGLTYGNTARAPTFGTGEITWTFGIPTSPARIASCAGWERGVKVFEFQKETTGVNGVTQTLPSLGFTPKLIRLFSSSVTGLGNPPGGDSVGRLCVGFATPSMQRAFSAVMSASTDNCKEKAGRVLMLVGGDASTPVAEGSITTFADQSVITWHTANTSAYRIYGVAYEEDPASGDTEGTLAGLGNIQSQGPVIGTDLGAVAGLADPQTQGPVAGADAGTLTGLSDPQTLGPVAGLDRGTVAALESGQLGPVVGADVGDPLAGLEASQELGPVAGLDAGTLTGLQSGELGPVLGLDLGQLAGLADAVELGPVSGQYPGENEGTLAGLESGELGPVQGLDLGAVTGLESGAVGPVAGADAGTAAALERGELGPVEGLHLGTLAALNVAYELGPVVGSYPGGPPTLAGLGNIQTLGAVQGLDLGTAAALQSAEVGPVAGSDLGNAAALERGSAGPVLGLHLGALAGLDVDYDLGPIFGSRIEFLAGLEVAYDLGPVAGLHLGRLAGLAVAYALGPVSSPNDFRPPSLSPAFRIQVEIFSVKLNGGPIFPLRLP